MVTETGSATILTQPTMGTAKRMLKAWTPPILAQTLLRTRKMVQGATRGRQRVASWYDQSFEKNEHWRRHYTTSPYFALWSIIGDRLVRGGVKSVLDVGCGPGQFASLIRDRGITKYYGVDFSRKRIDQAVIICPEFQFFVEDVFATDAFSTLTYDAVVMTEFLEHIQDDKQVIGRIPSGKMVLASVPSTPAESHVRYFENGEQVRDRYADLFAEIRVDSFVGDASGKLFHVIEGTV